MITVVYFISGFIVSFGTIFLRKVATFFYGRSPLWGQTKILWKKKTTLLGTTWGRQLPPYYEINYHIIVSSVPWMDDGTPTPNRKMKKILPFPSPQNPKKKKIGRTNCILSLPQCLTEIFIMGQYPFITGWIPILL
jgi:hypothetical protein